MRYQSLYRTWRPRTFSDMVGQEAILRALKNQAATKRVAHAYLFCGSRGTGKTSAARVMAMAINCIQPIKGDPCLVCEHCKALQSETTLDVFEMDAASNSRVEEIREMLTRTDYPPQFVPYKVYIIDEVHMLSNAAFNALLKTLEEPPPYMVFILATTEPQKLPATILSRCQRFDFGRISEEDIVKRLQQALSPEQAAQVGALQLIAATAQGSMRDAWSLLDMCLGAGDDLSEEQVRHMLGAVSQDFLFDFLDALATQDTGRALTLCDSLMKGGRDVQVFLREFNAHLRQVLAQKWTGTISNTASQRLQRQADSYSADLLLFLLEQVMQSEHDARWSASPRAVLELFALRCSQLRQQQDQGAVLARLGALESQRQNGVFVPEQRPKQTRAQEVAPIAPLMPELEPTNAPEPVFEPAPVVDEMLSVEPPTQDVTEAEPIATVPEAAPIPLQQDQEAPEEAKKSPKDAWNGLLKRLQAEQMGLFAYVALGKYGGYEHQVFKLVFEKENRIHMDTLNEEGRACLIAGILSEEMGTKVGFEAVEKNGSKQLALQEITEQNIQALAQVFGRDKIVLKND